MLKSMAKSTCELQLLYDRYNAQICEYRQMHEILSLLFGVQNLSDDSKKK